MLTASVAIVIIGGLHSQPSLLTPQIKQEITRVIALSADGTLPAFWPKLKDEHWEARQTETGRLELLIGGVIRVSFDTELGKVVAFQNDLHLASFPGADDAEGALIARAAAFDRAMGLPRYDYSAEWVKPFHWGAGPVSETTVLKLTRKWPGIDVPFSPRSESVILMKRDQANIHLWTGWERARPPVGPPPKFLPMDALRLQASAAALNLHPEMVAGVGGGAIYLESHFRLPDVTQREGAPPRTLWRRPLTPTQLHAQQQRLSIYLAEVHVGLLTDSGVEDRLATVWVDPATGEVDQLYVRPVSRRGAEPLPPRPLPSPGEAAWLARDGVRSRVVLTAPPAQKRPEGLPSGVLMAKDTARRVEIDPRAKVLWFQSAIGWRSLGWKAP